MGAWIELLNNATGEVRRYRDDYFTIDEDGASEFMWTEGSRSCDCNRALWFARANGEPDPEDRECGFEAFTAIRAICDGGEIVELEYDPRDAS